MVRKYIDGGAAGRVVVFNQDLTVEPMKWHRGKELTKIKTCGNCRIYQNGTIGAREAAGLRSPHKAPEAGRIPAVIKTGGPEAAGRAELPPGTGAVVPFASGGPVRLTAPSEGAAGAAGVIGFGSCADGFGMTGETMDVAGLPDLAFLLPAAGKVTAFAAHFYTAEPMEHGEAAVTITARLYQSPAPGTLFVPVPSTALPLSPALSGRIRAGSVCSGSLSNLSVPLAGGTRLMVVFTADSGSGRAAGSAVAGYASAGLSVR